MITNTTILSDSSFHDLRLHHGGIHRTSQLDELARRAGCSVRYVERQQQTPSWPQSWRGLTFLLRHAHRLAPATLGAWRNWQISHVQYHHALSRHDGTKLLIWENTSRFNWVAPYAARDAGCSVVAVPQNLETLYEAGVSAESDKSSKLIAQEIRHIACADAVYCLSQEDVSVLARHGVSSELLPYHPAKALMNDLLNVRAVRADSQKRGILLLGTFHNVYTRMGMLELIDWLGRFPLPRGEPVDIAGFGTEAWGAAQLPQGFVVHGTVTQERLRDLLIRTRAVVLLQRLTTGTLTRIPEMLVAGIPVLATPVTARSTTHFEGVHLFDTADELNRLVGQDWPTPPVPAAPVAAEQAFISKIRELAQ